MTVTLAISTIHIIFILSIELYSNLDIFYWFFLDSMYSLTTLSDGSIHETTKVIIMSDAVDIPNKVEMAILTSICDRLLVKQE
jgi:hypothetical protein